MGILQWALQKHRDLTVTFLSRDLQTQLKCKQQIFVTLPESSSDHFRRLPIFEVFPWCPCPCFIPIFLLRYKLSKSQFNFMPRTFIVCSSLHRATAVSWRTRLRSSLQVTLEQPPWIQLNYTGIWLGGISSDGYNFHAWYTYVPQQ